jgi:hypothetical protein
MIGIYNAQYSVLAFKGTASQVLLLQVFFHESSSPKHLKITSGSFQKFSKIGSDIRKSMWTLVSMTLAVNFAFGTAGVVDTSGKFATDINDTSFNDNGCKNYHWCQIGTISDSLHLKVNLKKKNYLYLTSTTKGVQAK